MRLLAIDTSTDYLSVAVTDGERVVARYHRVAAMSHSRLLMPVIERLMRKARLKPADLDGFCVSIGPGSFTGLRIGVTAVKALAYVLRKPIVTVPTLDAIAENAITFCGIICPVLDARKGKVYACLYHSDGSALKRVSKYLLLPLEDLLRKAEAMRTGEILFLGDMRENKNFTGPAASSPFVPIGATTASRRISMRSWMLQRRSAPTFPKGSVASPVKFFFLTDNWHPRADVIAHLGMRLFRRRQFISPEELEPLYLYSKECDIKGI